MALIEYDMRDNITERERIKSLKESVQRGFDEVSQSLEKKADRSNNKPTEVSLSDFVETSEDNGWTVEKWSDGLMKAYKTITFSSLSFTSATGGGYVTKSGNALPGGFTEAPAIIATVNSANGIMSCYCTGISASAFTIGFARHFNAGALTNVAVAVQAVGKWK